MPGIRDKLTFNQQVTRMLLTFDRIPTQFQSRLWEGGEGEAMTFYSIILFLFLYHSGDTFRYKTISIWCGWSEKEGTPTPLCGRSDSLSYCSPWVMQSSNSHKANSTASNTITSCNTDSVQTSRCIHSLTHSLTSDVLQGCERCWQHGITCIYYIHIHVLRTCLRLVEYSELSLLPYTIF